VSVGGFREARADWGSPTDSERAGVLEVACGAGRLVRKELELVVYCRPGLSSVEPADSRVILRSRLSSMLEPVRILTPRVEQRLQVVFGWR
jgi:hypothetical protein